jgi:DNA-binding transcriptional MerR regulator
MQAEPSHQFYTRNQVKDRLQISISTIRRYERDGQLVPSHRLPNGRPRYTDHDIKLFQYQLQQRAKDPKYQFRNISSLNSEELINLYKEIDAL